MRYQCAIQQGYQQCPNKKENIKSIKMGILNVLLLLLFSLLSQTLLVFFCASAECKSCTWASVTHTLPDTHTVTYSHTYTLPENLCRSQHYNYYYHHYCFSYFSVLSAQSTEKVPLHLGAAGGSCCLLYGEHFLKM